MCHRPSGVGERAQPRAHVSLEAVRSHSLTLAAALVVAAHEPHALRVEDLERQEQRDNLELMGAAVEPISVKHVACRLDVAAAVRREAVVRKQQQQVTELPVHVAKDLRVSRRKGVTCEQ